MTSFSNLYICIYIYKLLVLEPVCDETLKLAHGRLGILSMVKLGEKKFEYGFFS